MAVNLSRHISPLLFLSNTSFYPEERSVMAFMWEMLTFGTISFEVFELCMFSCSLDYSFFFIQRWWEYFFGLIL